ncbi:unnamed protein product [Cunninghamella blakesleeana]
MATAISTIVLNNTAILKQILQTNKADFFLTYTPKTKHTILSKENTYIQDNSDNNNSCRFLILDSSFNPPTKAHSSLLTHTLASYPKNYFNASILLFSINNADKKLTGASILQRAQMMEILARQWDETDNPVYVGLTTHGKFIDKSTAIQKWYQQLKINDNDNNDNNRQLELHFILGYDTITRFMDVKYYTPLKVEDALKPFFETCYLICCDRPGFNKEDDHDGKAFWNLPQVQYYIDKIKQLPSIPDESISTLSSTLARTLIANQKYSELNNVLDKEIIRYLLEEKIYQS